MTRVVLLGAGGHAKAVIELLRAMGDFELVLLDPRPELLGSDVLGVHVRGGDDVLTEIGADAAVVSVGSVGDSSVRRRLYELIRSHGLPLARAVHPAAIVSPSAELGDGPTVMATAVVGACTRLGDNVLVNTGAIIEHDCVIGSHAHVAIGARLAGGAVIGEGAHIGLGACVNGGVTVGEGAVVGSGAVVLRDVEPGNVVAGVPAAPLRERR